MKLSTDFKTHVPCSPFRSDMYNCDVLQLCNFLFLNATSANCRTVYTRMTSPAGFILEASKWFPTRDGRRMFGVWCSRCQCAGMWTPQASNYNTGTCNNIKVSFSELVDYVLDSIPVFIRKLVFFTSLLLWCCLHDEPRSEWILLLDITLCCKQVLWSKCSLRTKWRKIGLNSWRRNCEFP